MIGVQLNVGCLSLCWFVRPIFGVHLDTCGVLLRICTFHDDYLVCFWSILLRFGGVD